MKKNVTQYIILAAVIIASPVETASAVENGVSTYPAGSLTIYNGFIPAPGTYINMYNEYINKDKVIGNDGKKSFDAKITGSGHAIQIIHVFDNITFAGANVGFEIDQTYLDARFKSSDIGVNTSEGAFGDTTLGFRLGWHDKTVHQQLIILGAIPTGSYDKSETFNAGVNYYSGIVHYAVTWLPTKHIEASGELIGVWNAPNKDTDYRSGITANMNYSLNYHFDDGWFSGISGYWINQITDDKQNGETVNGNGNRLRTFAIGPQAGYIAPKWAAYLAWHHLAYVRNTSEGDVVWLDLSYKL
ncbi:transporter [Pseudomonas gingeri]|uniref:SphA family protein n=1 Tax=Pseudomonas gingeri TaxID=117681 RepID=UPI0015A3A940|nr:transporter [Pseudomonas gingeri]NWA28607.1 transporter [Pseudomonas gingeri]